MGHQQKLDAILYNLKNGIPVADPLFDELYSWSERMRSPAFWTPVRVAMCAAGLLAPNGVGRVLDVGSGVGKFCIVGAACTDALFVGLEQRKHLVRSASEASRRLGTKNAVFAHGTFEAADISTFDAIYFFNPFEENLWPSEDQLDQSVELSDARFVRDVTRVQEWLAGARAGTRVVTYHGLGTAMPTEYVQMSSTRIHSGSLDLWIKEEPLARCG